MSNICISELSPDFKEAEDALLKLLDQFENGPARRNKDMIDRRLNQAVSAASSLREVERLVKYVDPGYRPTSSELFQKWRDCAIEEFPELRAFLEKSHE